MKICFIGISGHAMQTYNEMKNCPDAEFVGIAPGSPEENIGSWAKFGIKEYASYETMLDTEMPDVCVVSPVFGLTAKIICACANRKIDVFSEKPVAGTLEELETVKRAVKENGIRFSAMHFLRYTPSFYEAAKLVRSGKIGDVKLVFAQKSYKFGTRPAWYGDRSLYTGTIPWIGIHAIDWIWCFAGKKYRSVKAWHSGNPEMTAVMQYRMDDDVFATVTLDYYRPSGAKSHGDDRVRCVGTKGIIEVGEKGYRLTDENGESEYAPTEAPKLAYEFIMGNDTIDSDEIFYLTEIALRSRESADTGKEILA